MKKKITLLLLSIVLMPCLLLLAACNKSVEFKINFIVDNEVYDTISTTGNTTISMPDDPIKEGYTFDGWYWDNDVWSRPFTANSLLDTPLVKDLRVYAKFNEIHVHSIVLIDAVEPTCSSSGNQKYYKCSTCNKLFSDETATTEIAQIPVLAKLSHISGDWQIIKTATCTSDGLKIKKCTLCGETLQNEIINATGHTPSAWNITKQPTCTEYGTKIKTCTICNAIVESENINPNGHVFSNWVITKQPTYTELGQEKRTCQNCSHYETRNIPTLTPTYVEPTSLILENGILKWNGSSPFGFELIVNNQSYIVQDNEFETTLKFDDYNSAKVACIYVDNTKSTYIELNNFIVNAPITNLHFVDDGTNVKFTWDSPSDLYDYTFIFNNIEKTVSKTQHYYSVPRNQLQKGTEVSIYVQGLASANFYPSKKYTITLDQLNAPNFKINKLNVEWDSVLNAQEYKVQALKTLTQTSTIYSYDGATDGEYTITVTAFGSDYLNNSATLTFNKLKKPNINIVDNVVTWDAIAGQVRYAVLIDDVETKFVGNSYTITNTQDEYDIYLYASPVQPNAMQSDRVIISKFTYEDYSTVYWGTIINSTLTYTNVLNGNALYVPNQYLANMNLKNAGSSRILIASKVPTGFSSSLVSSIIISNDTTEIVASAFSGCSNAISVTIPESVTSIGSSAFSGCTSLTSITIPESVTRIESSAFSGCSSLVEMTIPFVGGSVSATSASLSTLFGYIFGSYSYTGGTSIKQYYVNGSYTTYYLPSSLRKVTILGGNILYGAFYNCSMLTNITIPESVTSIGSSAFYNCTSLTGVNITNLDKWASIDFEGSSANPLCYAKKLYLNDTLVIDAILTNTTKISSYAFRGYTSLTSITIPESVTSIGDDAFYNCTSLTEVYITNLDKWASIDFEYYYANPLCYAKKLYLNGTLVTDAILTNTTKISSYAFRGYTSLTSITIPESVTSIGYGAFGGCSSLVEMTIPFVGGSVSATSASSATLFGYIFGTNSYTGGTSIQQYYAYGYNTAYYVPSGLRKVTVLGGNILYGAFYNCSMLTNITIPESVTSIGDDAFSGCTSLTSIIIPESVTSIGDDAFYNCTSLTGVYITNLDKWASIDFENYYANPLCYAKKLYLNGTLATDAILTNTTKILSYAFNGCTSLTSITIPESVTSIGSSAFRGCTSLTSITIPESVTSIGYDAFRDCTSLTGVYITNLDKWASIDFENYYANPLCYAKKLYLNGTLATDAILTNTTKISSYAFNGCTSLTSITIPESVTSIGSSAFGGCSSLVEMTIPFVGGSVSATSASSTTLFGYIFGTNSYTGGTGIRQYYANGSYTTYYVPSGLRKVTVLGGNILNCAFYNCSMLTDITIPESVTSIGDSAFSDCTSLTSITIPESVTRIGASALYNCTSLTRVYYKGGESDWNNIYIDSDNSNLTNATRYYYSEEKPINDGNYWHYVDGIVTEW